MTGDAPEVMPKFRVTLLHKHLGTKHEFLVHAPHIARALPAAQAALQHQIDARTIVAHPLDFVLLGMVEIKHEV